MVFLSASQHGCSTARCYLDTDLQLSTPTALRRIGRFDGDQPGRRSARTHGGLQPDGVREAVADVSEINAVRSRCQQSSGRGRGGIDPSSLVPTVAE